MVPMGTPGPGPTQASAIPQRHMQLSDSLVFLMMLFSLSCETVRNNNKKIALILFSKNAFTMNFTFWVSFIYICLSYISLAF